MHRNRLVWMVYPYYLIIIFFSLLAVWLYASKEMRATYMENVASDLESRAQLAAGSLRSELVDGDYASIDRACKHLGLLSNTRITVVGSDGVVYGDTDEDPATMENHGRREELLQALTGQVGIATRYSNTLQRNMMYVAVPMSNDNAVIGAVRTSIPVSDIDTRLASFNTSVAIGGLVVTVFATLMSLLIIRRINRPLAELKLGADAFAKGELGTRVAVSDIEEIDVVADAMNHMATQLDERIETIIKQRNEQEAVLRSMVEGVVAIDGQERVLNLNKAAAAFFEVERDWAQGRSIQEVVRNVEIHRFASKALESTEPIETEITLEGDRQRFLRAHGSVLQGAAGARTGAVLVLNDSTRLRRLESIRREFVANVSHELKTPITSIRGFVETMLDGAASDPSDFERFLHIIDRQAKRLNDIVEDLLSLSRIEKESEDQDIQLSRESLRPILQNSIQSCGSRASEHEIKLHLECDDGIVAQMNSRYLEQAVNNLLDNAIKYSPAGSRIVLSGVQKDNRVMIRVADQGCGIEAKHLERLFERFYRVDKARSRDVGGTGLGLAIVKHIALAHNGSVHVESTPGVGSTFEICLPLPD